MKRIRIAHPVKILGVLRMPNDVIDFDDETADKVVASGMGRLDSESPTTPPPENPFPQYALGAALAVIEEMITSGRLSEGELDEAYGGAGGGGGPAANSAINLAASERYLTVTVLDDGTPSGDWPERVRILFDPVTGETVVTFANNEYGETRIISAKPNTVGFRVFEKQYATSTDHSSTVPVMQVMTNRDNRVSTWAVYPGGRVEQVGDLDVGGTVSADNVQHKVVCVPVGTPGWEDEVGPTLWIEYDPNG